MIAIVITHVKHAGVQAHNVEMIRKVNGCKKIQFLLKQNNFGIKLGFDRCF
jgi:hypothetical protein